MHWRHAAELLVGFALAVSLAQAQTTVRVRGTITAIDGKGMAVKSRDGRDLRLDLAGNATVAVAKAVRFDDFKPGDYVGTTTTPGPDGTQVALEVHFLPATAAEGVSPSEAQPGALMTNASVASTVAATGNRELTVRYQGKSQKIVVPEGIPLVRTVPGSRADLVAGEYVFVVAQTGTDGGLTALRIQVSKDGVRPPQ